MKNIIPQLSKSEKRSLLKLRGVILQENNNIVVISTFGSQNPKTGNMNQIWILYRHESPSQAVKSGLDSHICGDCKHRPANGGSCYVNVAHAPQTIWKAYKRGNYKHIDDIKGWQYLFEDEPVRFGAYGDPSLIDIDLVETIVNLSSRYTGYTHFWHKTDKQEYRKYFMASVETPMEYYLAKSLGWRMFIVIGDGSDIPLDTIECPNQADPKIQCANCGLCNGSNGNSKKHIYINVHGIKNKIKNFSDNVGKFEINTLDNDSPLDIKSLQLQAV